MKQADFARDEDEIAAEMTSRAWLVGQILPAIVLQDRSASDTVALAIELADEAIKQLKQHR